MINLKDQRQYLANLIRVKNSAEPDIRIFIGKSWPTPRILGYTGEACTLSAWQMDFTEGNLHGIDQRTTKMTQNDLSITHTKF